MTHADQHLLAGMSILSAIVDTGSFGGAAEVLEMSQSGVSRAIARLEAKLGVRLLDRTTRSVTLTDDGRRLIEQVMPVLAALEEGASSALGGATRVHGRLRVNVDLASDAHTCVRYRDPETGRPFDWDFKRGRKAIKVDVAGRLTVNDVATMHGVCLSGQAVAQVMALGVEPYIADGRLVELFADWPDDVFPVYAYYSSRHHVPARVRAFLDFVGAIAEKFSSM